MLSLPQIVRSSIASYHYVSVSSAHSSIYKVVLFRQCYKLLYTITLLWYDSTEARS